MNKDKAVLTEIFRWIIAELRGRLGPSVKTDLIDRSAILDAEFVRESVRLRLYKRKRKQIKD